MSFLPQLRQKCVVMQKTTYVFPIVGGRTVEHLLANIEALSISLSEEQIKELEAVEPLDFGFPGWMIVRFLFVSSRRNRVLIDLTLKYSSKQGDGREYTWLMTSVAHIDMCWRLDLR